MAVFDSGLSALSSFASVMIGASADLGVDPGVDLGVGAGDGVAVEIRVGAVVVFVFSLTNAHPDHNSGDEIEHDGDSEPHRNLSFHRARGRTNRTDVSPAKMQKLPKN